MGEANGPVLGVSTFQDYQDNKWQYVHTQYGVYDPAVGKVVPLKSRDLAHDLADDEAFRFGPAMSRHVSDWLPDE